ncbi:uncharacterized protein LOC143767303 [Ranitomeya variabilis]|uniref:uncharacterized protein LOC143767303 n=1 Tax=Ranitomeya variabilis TaxID=490064 RepID=UPI004056E239
METINTAIKLLFKNCFMVVLDLKDAYYHIPIYAGHQRYLRVAVRLDGVIRHFQYRALPFGISVAPRVFTKVMAEVMAHLHESNILIIPYLDDLLIVGKTADHCLEQLHKVMSALERLGWMLNVKKSRLQPMTVQRFLGLTLDSQVQECRLPQEKIDRLHLQVLNASKNPTMSLRRAMSLLGSLSSCIPAVRWAQYHTRILQGEGHHVRVFSDNRVTVAYINHQGGTRSKSLMCVADRLFHLAEQHLLSLTALHIRGAENTTADFLSRNTLRQGEWSLNGSIFNLIVERWGQPEVDLFATKENRKVAQFCSLNPRENPLSVDALLIDWNFRLAYAFPPLSLLPLVVRKIRKDKATVIIIAPFWPRRTWFPCLRAMSISDPWVLPDIPDLLSQGPVYHPRAVGLHLTAWILSGRC